MARIRTVKPEFWKHELLSELAPETHMLAAALLNYSDDEGYFNANPKLVKAECCPLREDSTSIQRCLDDLSRIGYIRVFFGTDGRKYGHVVKFSTHQRVDRPKDSVIKGLEDSSNNRRTIVDKSTEEGKGREVEKEGKGNEFAPSAKQQLDFSSWPAMPSKQTLDDWLAMRKRLRANVSQTVINRFSSELQKAVQFGYSVDFCLQECVTRNWRGFEVQWFLNSGVSHAQSKRFTQPSDNRDKAARAADEAFGIAERGVFEGDFTRADPYGLIEQSERGVVQDLDEGAL